MRKLIFILIALVSFSQAQTIQYIGAPTTTVISKGNFRTDSIFYLPKRTKLPTDTAAFRYQISDSSLYVWSGYQWLRAGGSGSINGTLTTNYIPKATGTATIGNSLLYTSGNNLMFNSTTPYTTNSGWSTSEVNATSVALNVWKINDTARGYIAHNGTLMEINNLRNGDLTFVTNSSTRGRFTSTGDFRVNTLGGTGSRVVVASSNGTLSAGSSATDLIDTTYISSRSWRQKGVDSLQFNVGLKVNISDTSSMLTPYLRKVDTTAMLSPYIRHADYGLTKSSQALSVDTALMATRLRVGKVIDSLSLVKQNVLTNPVTGTGTTNYVPKFTGTSTIGNSQIFDNGTNVGIGNTSPLITLHIGVGSTGAIPNGAGSGFQPQVQHTITSGIAGISSMVNDGTNNRRIGIFTDNTNGVSGISLSQSTGNHPFVIRNASLEALRINDGGELLINTTTDAGAYTLQNNGALYNTGSAILAATSGEVTIGNLADQGAYTLQNQGGFWAGPNIDNVAIAMAGSTAIRSTGSIFIDAATSGTGSLFIRTGSGFTNTITANASGETLFGTTTDAGAYRVQVNGATYISKTDGGEALVILGNSNTASLQQNGSDLYFNTNTNTTGGGFYFRNTSSYNVLMNLTSSGELLVGTTTDAGNYRVQVSGNAYISGILNIGDVGSEYINVTADQNSSVSTRIRNNNTGSSAYAMVGVNASGNSWGFRMGSSAANNNALEIVSNAFGTPVSRLNITTGGIVGIGTTSPNASSIVDISSTTGGFLPPRMTTTQRDAISSPAAGLVIYNTTTSKLQVYTTSWTDLH